MQKEIGTYWFDDFLEVNYKIINITIEEDSFATIICYDIEYARPIFTEIIHQCTHEELLIDAQTSEDEFLLDKIQ